MSDFFVEGVKTGRNTMTCSVSDNQAYLLYEDLDSGYSGLNCAVSVNDIAAIKSEYGDSIDIEISLTSTVASEYIGYFIGVGSTKETTLSGSNYFVPMQNVLYKKFNFTEHSETVTLDLSGINSGYLYVANVIGKNETTLASGNNTWYNAVTGTITSNSTVKAPITGYTVQFNANGGTGTMSDQSIAEGVATPLTANTFTKAGCRFDGWSTTQGGDVEYTDAEIVTDLTAAGSTITLYAVWTVTDYSIVFHANGGTGSMSDQYVTVGSFPALSANTYTRDGYTFTGWSYTASGTVVFVDGETIPFDLGDAGDVIDLYAVWDKIPIQGTLYTNNSPKNKLEKDLTSLATVNIVFKDTTDLIDPVFLFSGVSTDIIAVCNYIYVADLGRYYFVNKIETVRQGVWLLYCHVDVLSSYADEVKTQKAIIKRQETNNNLYINDGVFKVYQYSNIETFPFSSGFSTIQYVLMVAGN